MDKNKGRYLPVFEITAVYSLKNYILTSNKIERDGIT
jgi:hypothetical protein